MKKVLIKKQGVTTNQAKFATQELAEAWLAKEEASNSFGKPERWVAEDQLVSEGENIDNSIAMMSEMTSFGEIKLYKFAAEYTVEVVDITAEVAAAKKLSDRTKKRAFGEALIDKISTLNDGKNLSIEQVDAFMTNSLISNLREHLWAGNIDTFVAKLSTTEEKAAVLSECQTFLTSLGA